MKASFPKNFVASDSHPLAETPTKVARWFAKTPALSCASDLNIHSSWVSF